MRVRVPSVTPNKGDEMRLIALTLTILLSACATTKDVPVDHGNELGQAVHTIMVCADRVDRAPATRKQTVRCVREMESYRHWQAHYMAKTGLSEEEVVAKVRQALAERMQNR